MSMFDRVARRWKFARLLGLLVVLGFAELACQNRSPPVDASEASNADGAQAKDIVRKIRQEEAQAKREVQKHSKQVGDAAHEVAAKMEQRLAELERAPATQASPPPDAGHHLSPHEVGENEVIGLFDRVDGGWVSIRDASGFAYLIKTDSQTRITGPGNSVDLAKLPQGSLLSVRFQFRGKDRVARDIEVLALHRLDGA